MSMIWNVVRNNIVWNVGSGRTTDFWRDPWLDEVGPLIDYISSLAVPPIGPSLVAAMVDAMGHWRWNLFEHLLPQDIFFRIAAVKRPNEMAPTDSAGWRWG
ncbi:hypothetical protein V6N13_020146 [Hibiscus sabdariffa]